MISQKGHLKAKKAEVTSLLLRNDIPAKAAFIKIKTKRAVSETLPATILARITEKANHSANLKVVSVTIREETKNLLIARETPDGKPGRIGKVKRTIQSYPEVFTRVIPALTTENVNLF